jgi:hypothetical protein
MDMRPYLTEDEARERLRRKVAELGSQEKFAAVAGCSHTLISRVLMNGAPVGRTIADALGLVAIPVRSFQYLPREAQEAHDE